MGGEVPLIAQSDRPSTGFISAHFPPATDSPVRAIRPSAGPVGGALLFYWRRGDRLMGDLTLIL